MALTKKQKQMLNYHGRNPRKSKKNRENMRFIDLETKKGGLFARSNVFLLHFCESPIK